MSCAAAAAPVLIGGAVHTTAKTTAAGLRMANRKTPARRIRIALVWSAPPNTPAGLLLVRKIFKLRGQLANPSAVVEPADEASITLVPRHIHELFLRDESAEPSQVGISAVAHDPTNDPRQLTPLAFGKGLAVTRDRDQQRRGGPGDGVGQDLLALRPGDDFAASTDAVRVAVSPLDAEVGALLDGGDVGVHRS